MNRSKKRPLAGKTVTNIYILLLFSLLLTPFFIVSNAYFQSSELFNRYFSFTMLNIKQFRFWTLLSYSFSHDSFFTLGFSFFPILLLVKKLRKWYSLNELGRIFLYSTLSGALAHSLLAPENHVISGALGIVLAYLVLYCRVAGRKPLFQVFSLPVNLNMIALIGILFNFLTIQWEFRPDQSSFACHLGILVFSFFYMRTARYRNQDEETSESRGKKAWIKFPDGLVHPGKLIFTRTRSKNAPGNTPFPSEKDINRILDKISEQGIHSLSEKEREILNRASQMRSNSR